MGNILEMYASDHNGHYPKTLSELSPDYMKSIPTCRAAKKDTYSGSYTSATGADAYTIYCQGHNHPEFCPENYPMYSSAFVSVSDPEELVRKKKEARMTAGNLAACKSHLMQLGSAVEKYATAHKGKHPEKLSQLSPKYVKAMPICPSANKDSYTPSYQVNSKARAYSLFCTGKNHSEAGLAPDFPRYDAKKKTVVER